MVKSVVDYPPVILSWISDWFEAFLLIENVSLSNFGKIDVRSGETVLGIRSSWIATAFVVVERFQYGPSLQISKFESCLRCAWVGCLPIFYLITAMPWCSFDRITEAVITSLASVSNADGRSKLLGPGWCLDNTKMKGVIQVDRLTWMLYTHVISCTKLFQFCFCLTT